MSNKLELDFFNHNRKGKSGRILQYRGHSIESLFSDFEAFALCLGFEDSEKYLQKIARKYFFKNCYADKEVFEAHQASMNALQNYGYDFLISCLRLPKLALEAPFYTKEIFNLFEGEASEFRIVCYKEFKRSDFYNTFILSHSSSKEDEIFVEQILDIKRNVRVPIMKLYQNNKIKLLGCFTAIEIIQNIIPIINLLTNYHSDPNKLVLFYGLATSYCSICGHELTVPESIERGIGPICAGYVGISFR